MQRTTYPDTSQRVTWQLGYPVGQRYIPGGLTSYRKQDFQGGFILVHFIPGYVDAEAWLTAGPRIFYQRWPSSDFPP